MLVFPFAQQLWAAANTARCIFSHIGWCKEMSQKNDFAMFINHVVIIRRQADDLSLRWTTGWIRLGLKKSFCINNSLHFRFGCCSNKGRDTTCLIKSVGCYLFKRCVRKGITYNLTLLSVLSKWAVNVFRVSHAVSETDACMSCDKLFRCLLFYTLPNPQSKGQTASWVLVTIHLTLKQLWLRVCFAAYCTPQKPE